MRSIFIAGIGTGVGKTVVSAILVEALGADYWKPIQAGNLDYSDSDTVGDLISNQSSSIHTERYRLTKPLSPHAAAEIDSIEISLEEIILPQTNNLIIVEGAGGLMVPLNGDHLVTDLISHLRSPVIIVSKNYLGSINHTLLSIEALQRRDIPVLGIIFNGDPTPASEDIILKRSGLGKIGSVESTKTIDRGFIKQAAAKLKSSLYELIG